MKSKVRILATKSNDEIDEITLKILTELKKYDLLEKEESREITPVIIDVPEDIIHKINTDITFKGKDFKLELVEEHFNENKVLYINLMSIKEFQNIGDAFYELKVILKKVVLKFMKEIHWLEDTQNKYISAEIYLKIHETENKFRGLISEFMIKVYGINWFKNKIKEDYLDSIYKTAKWWLTNPDFEEFKNIKFELFNLQIKDLISILKSSHDKNYLYGIEENIRLIKEKSNLVLNDEAIIAKTIWEKDDFEEILGDDFENKWNEFSNLRNVIAHNKVICQNFYNFSNTAITDLNEILDRSREKINQLILSREEENKKEYIKRILEDERVAEDKRIAEEAGIEILPQELEVIEKIEDEDEFLFFKDAIEDFKDKIVSYLEISERKLEIIDYLTTENFETYKGIMFSIIEIIGIFENEKKILLKKFLNHIKENEKECFISVINKEVKLIIERFTNFKNNIKYDSQFEPEKEYLSFKTLLEEEITIKSFGYLCPEPGNADTIDFKIFKDKKCLDDISGEINKWYGDTELIDMSSHIPTHSDELCVNLEEITNYINEEQQNIINIIESKTEALSREVELIA